MAGEGGLSLVVVWSSPQRVLYGRSQGKPSASENQRLPDIRTNEAGVHSWPTADDRQLSTSGRRPPKARIKELERPVWRAYNLRVNGRPLQIRPVISRFRPTRSTEVRPLSAVFTHPALRWSELSRSPVPLASPLASHNRPVRFSMGTSRLPDTFCSRPRWRSGI
jgi:hypothetical protein